MPWDFIILPFFVFILRRFANLGFRWTGVGGISNDLFFWVGWVGGSPLLVQKKVLLSIAKRTNIESDLNMIAQQAQSKHSKKLRNKKKKHQSVTYLKSSRGNKIGEHFRNR